MAGYLNDTQVVEYLRNLPISELSEDELIDMVCSLGMIGNKNAIDLLLELKSNDRINSPNVNEEIRIALQSLPNDLNSISKENS